MFITDKRIEEIREQVNAKGIGALREINSEEANAFCDVVLGNVPKNERDRAICEAYKSGVLTQEDDPCFLC